MNKLLIGTGTLAVFAGIAITVYLDETTTVPDPRQPATAGLAPDSRSRPQLKLLQEPRLLPELRFADVSGRPMTLRDFRGKVVLLNLWATWCGPCREEMPALDRLQAKLGGPEFEVVALSIDQGGVPVIQDFYKELQLQALGIYSDPTMMAPSTLNVLGIPTTLVVNREGQEISRYLGPAEWDSPEIVTVIQGYLQADAMVGRPSAANERPRASRPPPAEPGKTEP
ncbi:MAG: TlpA family protein disulfide reductase [Acidiferrobacterales bacterium]